MKTAILLAACIGSVSLAQEKQAEEASAMQKPDTAIAQFPGYTLVWHDEFDTEGPPDPAKWGFEQGFCRNQELQWYQRDNVVCRDGLLVFEGRKEKVKNPNYKPGSTNWKENREYAEYTSSSINTWGKHSWRLSESMIVVRARLTPDNGYWPAIWTTGPGQWPHGGEVDLMECYGGRILGNFAWGTKRRWHARWHPYNNPNHSDKNKPRIDYFLKRNPDWLTEFHVWKLVGTDEKITILLDDEIINEVTHETATNPKTQFSNIVHPFKEKHSLILNLAIGGQGGSPRGARLPLVYEVDYARVYKRD